MMRKFSIVIMLLLFMFSTVSFAFAKNTTTIEQDVGESDIEVEEESCTTSTTSLADSAEATTVIKHESEVVTVAKMCVTTQETIRTKAIESDTASGEPMLEHETTEGTTVLNNTETTINTYDKIDCTYTDDDLFCLAAVVYREAGNQSDEMQLLVANVVINRVNSPLFPDTIRGVLTQYRQYGMMWKYGISLPDNPSECEKEAIERCYDVARRVLDGERHCPDNVLFQAEFKQGRGVYRQVGIMYFCYY